MRPTKVCPVVVRLGAGGYELLVFRHPTAGVQLVKGTVERDEDPAQAALRELAEESGITAADIGRSLGVWDSGYEHQVWAFFEVRVSEALPAEWKHFARDGGGQEFVFSWHPLSQPPTTEWHSLFVGALDFVRASLPSAAKALRGSD